MKTIVLKQFTLAKRDWLRAALMSALVPVLILIQQSVDAGEFHFEWKKLAMSAIGGFVAYLLKSFLEPTKTVVRGDQSEILKNVDRPNGN